ncbi:hypothetical protein E4U53_004747, partial [Claviceps sorghi]
MTPILILDGGLGTSLEKKYHVRFGPATPLWSTDLVVSAPHTLLQCQSDFARLPVDIILTATYQVSERAFAQTCQSHASYPQGIGRADIPRFLDRAVSIAESATQQEQTRGGGGGGGGGGDGNHDNDHDNNNRRRASVALSLGPYGATMVPSQEYTGRYDAEHDSAAALSAWHRDRLALFGEVGGLADRVSHLALETLPRADE